MAYIAIHYVNLNGTVYMPGEAIEQDMEAAQAERLLEKGAIRKKVTPDSFLDEEDKQANTAVTDQGDGEGSTAEDAEDTEGAEDDADADTEDTEDDADADTEEEEYEDAEPPEIDVADSIVAPAEEQAAEEKKPARKRRGGKEKA